MPLGAVGAAVVLLAAAAVLDKGAANAAALLVLVSVLAAAHRFILRWDVLTAIVLVVVLSIPIKRYGFAADLPFDLEPYRIVIALVVGLWCVSLLIDPNVRLRRTAFDAPLLLFGLAVVASVALNPGSITEFSTVKSILGDDLSGTLIDASRIPAIDVSDDVAKGLLFLASFYLVYYFVTSTIRDPDAIHAVVKTLVAGSALVAASAIIERRTGYNVFDRLDGWIPLLNFEGAQEGVTRGGGRLRVYASAQHPIALAGLFAIVLPVAVYLSYVTRRYRWYAASAVIFLGALATVSRTSVTMLAAAVVVFLALRPAAVKPLLLAMLPLVIVVHLVVPGAIGGLRVAFFPSEGLIADQTTYGGRISSERLGPQFDIIRSQPLFGQGYATRVTAGEGRNARILDNQWLGTAVETGLVGLAAWIWLFLRFLRKAGGAARSDPSARGWLLTSIAASMLAFAVGMLTYDAFSFIQVTVVMFVLLALGASVLASQDTWPTTYRATPASA